MAREELFSSEGSAPGADGMTQAQREAVADLLHYCMLADRHVALAETTLVAREVDKLGWDPEVDWDLFAGRSVAQACGVGSPEAEAAFVAAVRDALGTPEARAKALALAERLLKVGGLSIDAEGPLLERLREALA